MNTGFWCWWTMVEVHLLWWGWNSVSWGTLSSSSKRITYLSWYHAAAIALNIDWTQNMLHSRFHWSGCSNSISAEIFTIVLMHTEHIEKCRWTVSSKDPETRRRSLIHSCIIFTDTCRFPLGLMFMLTMINIMSCTIGFWWLTLCRESSRRNFCSVASGD